MGWLTHLFGREPSSAPPARSGDERPEPSRLAASPTTGNPIQSFLDELALPWREPRGAVGRRLGTAPHPFYRWDVLRFDAARPLPGFMLPWTAQAFENFSPELPITSFDGLVWFESDAEANLRRANADLSQRLGPAAIGRQYNPLVSEWRSGAASVGLIAWPARWQTSELRIPAEEAEPRLATACHLHLQSGFRLPATAEEREWLAGFQPLAAIVPTQTVSPDRIAETAPSQYELDYVREPPGPLSRLHGQVGRSADGRALIFCTNQLFVIPLDLVLGFEVDRCLPAKGGGGSTLAVRCRTACAVPSKHITLSRDDAPDGLNDLGQRLARAFDRPLEIGAYTYDV